MTFVPQFASTTPDSILTADENVDRDYSGELVAELWARHWLYSGKGAVTEITRAIDRAVNKKKPGTSETFQAAYEQRLLPLRTTNSAEEIGGPTGLDAIEQRLWGSLVSRISSYLKADGVIALVPEKCDEAVAVPFRFIESDNEPTCFDADGPHQAWTKLLLGLRDGKTKVIDGDLSVIIDARFAEPPTGDSLGLALAIGWERWKAKRGMAFYSPLAVVSTGELNLGEGRAVAGTGGQFQGDITGGAKGKLAEKIGARFFVGLDIGEDFRPLGTTVVRCTSSESWTAIRRRFVSFVGKGITVDSPAYLFRLAADEELIAAETDQATTWSRIRRLSRLVRFYASSNRPDEAQRAQVKIDLMAFGLGFKQRVVRGLEAVEKRHRHHYGRIRELNEMDAWLHTEKRVLLITGPVGRGKSALLTEWNRRLVSGDRLSIFFHYISQNDNTNGSSLLYRRLIEHLYWEIEEVPPVDDATDLDGHVGAMDLAWKAWENAKFKRPLLIIIDGLDEAIDEIAPLFPSGDRVPENVWMVASCRNGDGLAFPVIQRWRDSIGPSLFDSWELGPIDDQSLETWVSKEIRGMLRPNEKAFLVERLQQITSGMTLFIRHVLADVKETIKANGNWRLVLYNTPTDFIKYLRVQWKIFDTLVAKQSDAHAELGREMVLTLIAARGPLTTREFKLLLKKDAGFEEPFLPALRWMDIQKPDGEWGEVYTLNHESIRYALKETCRS